MDILTDEVLIEIFEWLPLRTRQLCRLVCQRWNQICLCCTFTKDEKIVFSNGYGLDIVAPLFDFDRRRILNLRFIGKSFHWTDAEISFWRSYGERVESLHLTDGAFNFIDLKKVIEFCPNLQSLRLHCYRDLQEWLRDFDEFVAMNFTSPSVTTFHFQVDSQHGWLNNYQLSNILAIFPNLTNLELNFLRGIRIGASDDPSSRALLCMNGTFKILEGVAKNLKKLHFTALGRSYLGSYATTLLSQLENIEELTLNFHTSFIFTLFSQPYTSLLKLTELTSLNLDLNIFGLNCSGSKFITTVLHEFRRLRYLNMNMMGIVELDEVLIENLVSSELETLSLNLTRFNLGATVQQYSSSNVNRKLETISIRCSYFTDYVAYDHFFSILPRYFQNVMDLTVSKPSDAILQHIFKYQERLRKLRLESCSSCTDFGFTGLVDSAEGEQTTYCISELSNLEYLRIDPAHGISEKTFACFVFPNLKTLELMQFGHSNRSLYLFRSPMPYLTKFEFLIEYSHALEVLKLDFTYFVPQEELEEILRPFKLLRCVQISDRKRNESDLLPLTSAQWKYDYFRFFEICPFLRKFIHNEKWCYVNILTKNLVVRKYPRIRRIPSPWLL